jgi:hypothetical protein
MVKMIVIKAVVKDGLIKPLEAIDLPEDKVIVIYVPEEKEGEVSRFFFPSAFDFWNDPREDLYRTTMTEDSTLVAVSPKLRSWNIAGSSGTWQGEESPAGSEIVARYQRDIMGTWESQCVLLKGVGGNKTGLITYPVNGGEVLPKSRMRENLKSGSRRWL